MPEMLKVGQTNSDFMLMLSELVRATWKEILEKGNLHCYDNWQGIALLDVTGKWVARIV